MAHPKPPRTFRVYQMSACSISDVEPVSSTSKENQMKVSQDESTAGNNGIRRSRRYGKGVNNEMLNNFNNGNGDLDRNMTPPKGLGHTPFQFFKEELPEKTARQRNSLKIDMKPVFNHVDNTPGYQNHLNREADRKKKNTPKASEQFMIKTNNESVKVGKEHQCSEISDYNPSEKDFPKREDVIWIPPPKTQFFSNIDHQFYWRAIWRQFKGHIPYSYAIQNLQKNEYDLGKSLESIDQMLKVLPQEIKPICTAQFDKFRALLVDGKVRDRRVMQRKALRNYHLGEVTSLYYKYKEFHHSLPFQKPCNCDEFLLEDIDFVPRWACSNCVKNLEAYPRIPPDQLCLICQTYQKRIGKPRPAENSVFWDSEMEKVQNWISMELQKGDVVSREEFEDVENQKFKDRLMKMELTLEEKDMLFESKLLKKKDLTEEDKRELVRLFTPNKIPIFLKCQCGVKKEELVQKVTVKDALPSMDMADKIAEKCAELLEQLDLLPPPAKRRKMEERKKTKGKK